ncbi:MAG: hypothetical protein WAW86_10410 [Gammaproteobacteria bacterium]
MKATKVLLIGPSFLYDLVDEEILRHNNIIPIYSYKLGSSVRTTTLGTTVYYDELLEEHFVDIIDKAKPAAIVCYNDNFLIQAANLRDRFSIRGITSDQIGKFKLKSEMYKAVEDVLSVPKTIKVTSLTTPQAVIEYLGQGPYFLKPDNLAGAEGTALLSTLKELDSWFTSALRKDGQYVIQQFHDLSLVHCEMYIQKGEVLYIQPRRYAYPNHKFLEGKILASLPIVDDNLCKNIELATKEVAKSMAYNDGVMHTEFFLGSKNKLIFLETNIRQAGAAINLVHKKRTGLSMETAMILLELGKSVPLDLKCSGYEICGYIPMQKGKVIGIDIPQLKGHYDFDIRVKIGEICYNPKSASNTSVAFIGYSDSLKDLEDDLIYLENNSIIKYLK